MRVRNLLILLVAVFSFAACSSDDPIDDNGGGNGNGNGKIPPKELEGQWFFERYYYDVKVSGNTEVENDIKRRFDEVENSNNFPKGGYLRFAPGKQSLAPYLDFTEGLIGLFITIDPLTGIGALGDYFTKGDTIFYYPYDNNISMRYMLKSGNRIQYIIDKTESYKTNVYPGKGIEKVVYYVDYKKR